MICSFTLHLDVAPAPAAMCQNGWALQEHRAAASCCSQYSIAVHSVLTAGGANCCTWHCGKQCYLALMQTAFQAAMPSYHVSFACRGGEQF